MSTKATLNEALLLRNKLHPVLTSNDAFAIPIELNSNTALSISQISSLVERWITLCLNWLNELDNYYMTEVMMAKTHRKHRHHHH